ncbi:MAG TPA: phage tail protein [Polyangiaceae bacterium]|nr:phage tail protein [Polyangiaceae bacterium]
MATRANPYGVFNFKVDFANGVTASFSEVSGLDSEQGVIEYRTGEDDTVMSKHPGLRKHSNVVLKRGIIGTTNLWAWREQVMNGIGNTDDTEGKAQVTVHLLNEKREPVVTWKLNKAWPVKWVGPSLAASKNETALETLELAHEGITME